MDGKSEATKRTVKRRQSKPNYRVSLPCGKEITVRQTTEDGHPADEIEGPAGMKIERLDVDSAKPAAQ